MLKNLVKIPLAFGGAMCYTMRRFFKDVRL